VILPPAGPTTAWAAPAAPVGTGVAPGAAPAAAGTATVERAWRLAPAALAILAGALYLWNLDASGYANTYYSAAAQAAGQSWTAMFFGSIDAAGFITVDKPPVSLWLMGLSVRLLGLNPMAVLLPEALCGVASVLFLWDAVRRQLGRLAALIAGVLLALTPVAVLMFRYNNPDALLVLLLVAAAWAVVRGLDRGRIRWVVLASVLVGFAFLTKYLQAYLVLPAFALAWLVAAPGGLGRRLGGLAAAALTVAVASMWWVVGVDLIPAASRPYIGGSTNNTAVDLLLGYDGLGRIFGGGGGAGARPGGGPGGPGGFGGAPGLLRMFNQEWGGEIAWVLPAAAIGMVAGLVARLRAPRTDRRRAAFLLWGTWGLVHVLVFSLMGGIAHPYYAVAIAPAAAALVGGGIAELWALRHRVPWAVLGIAAMLIISAVLGWQILERTPDFWPGAGVGAVFVAVAASLVLVAAAFADDPRSPALGRIALAVGLAAILTGPVLFAGATISKPINGGDPAAGPDSGRFGGFPGGFGRFRGDAAGTDEALTAFLVANRGDATWLVAVASANQAGPVQLATGMPVMAMGGFMGSDPAPTLDQLKAYVTDGRLRYVLLGGFGGGPGGFFGGDGQGSVAGDRTAWVQEACTPVTQVSTQLYDCAAAR
jgi:4-amino-4-deoxy-L-arabinose transferase-like glycosyltransferase